MGKERAVEDAITALEEATIHLRGWSLSQLEHTNIQCALDDFQMVLDAHRTGCHRSQTPLEYHLQQAASLTRGRMMSEDEWQYNRDLWVQIGQALAPCRAPRENADDTEEDSFDRAMRMFD